jgi:ribulose-phosphate 3-epimerase
MVKVYPSILSADFSKLAEEINIVEKAGADGIHIDVMDGHFVNNITIGAPIVKSIRKSTNLFFDVHLMIENPEKYIKDFADAGANSIIVHVEAVKDIKFVIDQIKSYGIKAGISINPDTDIPDIEILRLIDLILVMSVNPGFGGQKYIDSVTDKLRKLKIIKEENFLNFEIEIDGGINAENVAVVIENGVNTIIAGSYIFNAENKKTAIETLSQVI